MAKDSTELPYRRRFPRRQFRNSIGILTQGKYIITSGTEIGEGGLLFQTVETLSVGTDVVVNFFIPGRSFVTVRAELLYLLPVKEGQKLFYGIKFHNISFEAKRMIRDYIAEKTAIEAAAI